MHSYIGEWDSEKIIKKVLIRTISSTLNKDETYSQHKQMMTQHEYKERSLAQLSGMYVPTVEY